MSLRVLIADDHRIVREGLRSLLEAEPDIHVVGEAGDGREAIALARELQPDVVIMDIAMPLLNGVEATRQIVPELAQTRVIMLSVYADRRFVAEALRAGATGYVAKDCAYEELVRAVRAVVVGKTYLCPRITSVVVEDYVRRAPTEPESAFTLLTARERQVLQLLAEGKTTREIAGVLGVAVKTAETHRQNMMKKLGTRSLADLTRYAIREGLTTL